MALHGPLGVTATKNQHTQINNNLGRVDSLRWVLLGINSSKQRAKTGVTNHSMPELQNIEITCLTATHVSFLIRMATNYKS
jgi:hypothetical protein